MSTVNRVKSRRKWKKSTSLLKSVLRRMSGQQYRTTSLPNQDTNAAFDNVDHDVDRIIQIRCKELKETIQKKNEEIERIKMEKDKELERIKREKDEELERIKREKENKSEKIKDLKTEIELLKVMSKNQPKKKSKSLSSYPSYRPSQNEENNLVPHAPTEDATSAPPNFSVDENFPTDFTATGQDNPPDEFLTKLPASPTGPDNPSDEPHSSSDNTPDGKSSDSNESDYEPVESSFDQGDEGEELCFCNIGHPPGPHCNRGNSRTVPFTIVTRMVDQFNTERDLRSNEKNLPSKRNLSDLPQPEAKKQRTEPKL